MRSNQYLVDWAIINRHNLNCLNCSGMVYQELDDEKVLKVAE